MSSLTRDLTQLMGGKTAAAHEVIFYLGRYEADRASQLEVRQALLAQLENGFRADPEKFRYVPRFP